MELSDAPAPVRYFERRPDDRLQITDRDLDALALLDELILMNTHHMRALFGDEFVRTRLKRLYHHGYIERVEAQRRVRLLKGGGSQAIVVSLTNKGARLLKDHGRLRHQARDWNERNRLLKPWSLPHPLAVADVAVSFDLAFHSYADHGLTRRADTIVLRPPGHATPLYPDLTHELIDHHGNRTILAHEIDRGTMPNTRTETSALQSLQWKFERYLAYARSGRLQDEFGTKALRVLTIVSGGETKKQNVAQTALAVCHGNGFDRFLIATIDDVRKDAMRSWINAAGEPRSLVSGIED